MASVGYDSPGAYGYDLIAWKGRGSTLVPKAVLRSESLIQPSVYSRKSRVQSFGNAVAELASNWIVASSPGPMTTYMSSGPRRRGSTSPKRVKLPSIGRQGESFSTSSYANQ